MKHFGAISCRYTLVFLIFLSLGADGALADGLLQQMPPKGTAVKYEFHQSGMGQIFESGKGDNEPQKTPMDGDGHIQLAVVGSAVVAGLKCRWIEIEHDMTIGDQRIYTFAKLLIPEEDVIAAGDPLVRALRIFHADTPEAMPTLVKSQKHRQAVLSRLSEMIPRLPNAENRVNMRLQKQDVEIGGRKLSCTGRVFDYVVDRYVPNGPHRDQGYFFFRVFSHSTSPTGTVYMEVLRESQLIGCENLSALDKLQRMNVSTISRYRLMNVAQDVQSRFPEID